MESLRNELIESQKVRSDLVKWKLLIVSGIGGAALGFSGDRPGSAPLALAILPLACAYVDLLCRHLSLRTKSIGIFIKNCAQSPADLKEYERWYSKLATTAWRGNSLEA